MGTWFVLIIVLKEKRLKASHWTFMSKTKWQLMAGLVAETFGKWLEIEYLFVREELGTRNWFKTIAATENGSQESKLSFCFCEYTSFKRQILSKSWQGSFTCKLSHTGKDTIIKKDLWPRLPFFERNLARYQKNEYSLSCKMIESFC